MASEEFETIAPAPVQLSTNSGPVDTSPSKPAFNFRLAWASLALLAVVGVVIIAVVPKTDATIADNAASQRLRDTDIPPTQNSATNPTVEETSPYQAAVTARARRAAQDSLAELLVIQEQLVAQQVQLWADAPYSDATAIAQAGDAHFSERQYDQAVVSFDAARLQMQEIQASGEALFQQAIGAAADALAQTDGDSAETQLAIASAIKPTDPDVAALQARRGTLPQVVELLAAAERAHSKKQFDEAIGHWQAIKAVDAAFPHTDGAIAELRAAQLDANYLAAMSEGFVALSAQRFSTARKAFTQAQRLRPNSTEARQALAQLGQSTTLAAIQRHQEAAARATAAGNWSAALSAYQAALKLDPSLQFASAGARRLTARQALSTSIAEVLATPGKLSDEKTFAQAVALYQRAIGFDKPDAELQTAIDRLEKTLEVASEPVRVTLVSDNQTEVRILRVGGLGAFSSKDLSLRPGLYTVVGTRDGFRDIRREVSISANMQPLAIACEERI